MVSVAVLLMFGNVNAAETARGGRSMMPASSAARMPMLPTVSLNTFGNTAVKTFDVAAETQPTQTVNPTPTPTPAPTPTPTPEPKPDPTPTPTPKPVLECEDGGVKNSKYTVDMCMRDLRQCVETGALQGGLNDLFNEEVRNAIFSGMKLCQSSVDKCLSDVRVNCRNIYNDKNDVWLDFNSRIIQPEYYNFVLRKTGLSPHQAENTCLLLDRNTYGASFTSVSDVDAVRAEYQKRVGAYNGADGKSLSKDKPLGVEVNNKGYDAQRGHYARWDAANAECLIRVGAYNKNSPIKNSWLFGAVGNDNLAEVWKPAGSRFTCNKDLFGFDLLNDTKTAAVIGIAGGAVVGAGVGAGIGAGVYNAKKKDADAAVAAAADICSNDEYRLALGTKIKQTHNNRWLELYLYEKVEYDDENYTIKEDSSKKLFPDGIDYANLTVDQCNAIHDLYANVRVYEEMIKLCKANTANMKILSKTQQCLDGAKKNTTKIVKKPAENGKLGLVACGTNDCLGTEDITESQVNTYNNECRFVPLAVGFALNTDDSPLCNHDGQCRTVTAIENELDGLKKLLKEIEPSVNKTIINGAKNAKKLSKGAMIGKGAAIGAAVGVGTGGLATAITAFVERSNISCKVGDGLNSVSMGKSHTIDTLKDFYVKWNLQLPDAITPTSVVTDAESWEQACEQFNNKLYDCPNVQINYKKNGKFELIPSACKISGNLCIVNDAVAISRGEDEKEIEVVIIKVGEPVKDKEHFGKGKPMPKPHGDKHEFDENYEGWYPGGVYAKHAYDGPTGSNTESTESTESTGDDTEGE